MGEQITREELLFRLQELGGITPALEKGMQTAALNMERVAKENCTPGMSPYYRAPMITGWLRESIESMVTVDAEGVVCSIFDPVEYAVFVHDGTYRMPARPFILDSILSERENTLEAISRAVEEHIEKVAKG